MRGNNYAAGRVLCLRTLGKGRRFAFRVSRSLDQGRGRTFEKQERGTTNAERGTTNAERGTRNAERSSSYARALPAINRQYHTCDELCLVGREEQRGVSDVPRRSHFPAKRHARVSLEDQILF